MTEQDWNLTTHRFVAFFDILGFKDLVIRKNHSEVLKKLQILKEVVEKLQDTEQQFHLKSFNIEKDQTKAVTFSDSIIFFSKGDTFNDGLKILHDSYRVLQRALENGIAIKGSISFGEMTVDFPKSLFFGQPIIDAFLLHEDLEMLSIILDNSAETKFNSFDEKSFYSEVLTKYKANLKTGKINHLLISPYDKALKDTLIKNLNELYGTCYGRPRIYIDNTLEYLSTITRT